MAGYEPKDPSLIHVRAKQEFSASITATRPCANEMLTRPIKELIMKRIQIPKFEVTSVILALMLMGIIGTFIYVVFSSMNW